MKKKLVIGILGFLGLISHINAQQNILVSQYMFSGMFLNPAYAGTHEYFNATGLFRKQWVGFDGAPTSQFLSIDGPLKGNNSGAGLTITHDKIGVSRTFELSGNYAYHLKMNSKFSLSLGLKATLMNYSARYDELIYWDQDQVYETNIRNSYMPNFGVGGYLFSTHTFLGVSIPNILSYDPATSLSISSQEAFKLVRSYYVHGGHAFVFNQNLTLKPSTLMKFTPNTPLQFDLNLNALIKETVWVGATYRTDETVVGIIELLVSKKVRIGYAYGYATGKLRAYQSGSHEIMAAFDFGNSQLKVKNPRYF